MPSGIKYYLPILLILLGACGPQAPASATPPASLVPVDLAGPQMKLGSTFLYADGTSLVAVPGGPFTMGSDGPDNPKHQVTLPDFWIYGTKVTNGQFAYCVAMGLCTPPLKGDDPGYSDSMHLSEPAVGMTYDQAAAYCAFTHARLPSEAEWEKTARGPDANLFPWGNGAPSCNVVNFGDCVGGTTPVNKYPGGRSYFGAFDMEGNALEWVADWYRADYYSTAPAVNPLGPEHAHDRVVRSSAFNSGGDQLLAANRFHSPPDIHRGNLGFRCVVDNPTYFAAFCSYPATYGTDGIGGEAGGPQSIVDCPTISINQDEQCLNGQPITYVTFSGPSTGYGASAFGSCHPTNPNASSSPINNWTCEGNGQLTICSGCNVTLKSPPQCPAGYQFNPATKQCESQHGNGGACLPGFALQNVNQALDASGTSLPSDSGNQCCVFVPPTTKTDVAQNCHIDVDTNVLMCEIRHDFCPPGTNFDGKECLAVSLLDECKNETVALASCTQKGGPACQPPAGGCGGFPFAWDQDSCNCINLSP